MKEGIHPTYFPEATVICSCGNSWHTGSTVEVIHTDICSDCHPFYTGEQRIVDTEGQVDRFYRKLQAREEYLSDAEAKEAAKTSPDTPVSELELGKRTENALTAAEITNAGEALAKLAEGDEALLSIDGFGRKSLADLKRRLKSRGFQIPEKEAEAES
jgi:large subunit ribosomal protein L31